MSGRSSHAVGVVFFFVVHDGCLYVLVISPSLSHSSQLKALRQSAIESYEQVSDECSSGVMRAWHVAQSIPGVSCVQQLSAAQKKLSQPSLSGASKFELEKDVKYYEKWIQTYKKYLLDEEENALGQLTCKYKDLALIDDVIGERSEPLSGHVNGSSRYIYIYIRTSKNYHCAACAEPIAKTHGLLSRLLQKGNQQNSWTIWLLHWILPPH